MQSTARVACISVLCASNMITFGVLTENSMELNQEPTAPFEVVDVVPDATQLIARLDDQTEDIWLDGDVLRLVKRSPKGPWKTIGGVSIPLTQIEGSNLWTTGLRWDRWSETFIQVGFLSETLPADTVEYTSWRGEHAPAAPTKADPSKSESFPFPGPIIGSERTITVVLPPNYTDGEPLPAIVLADGQSAEAWGRIIAALVLEGKARPVAVVGVHSGAYEGDRALPYDAQLDIRVREYLEGFDQDRFTSHLNWVIDSVLPEVARKYTISLKREDLAIAGFSNGGAFAATAALRRGDVFSMALAMSVGIPPDIEPRIDNAPLARFFFAAGELEHNFLAKTQLTREQVEQAGSEAQLVTYAAGHDAEMWSLAMSRFVPVMFPPLHNDRDMDVPTD